MPETFTLRVHLDRLIRHSKSEGKPLKARIRSMMDNWTIERFITEVHVDHIVCYDIMAKWHIVGETIVFDVDPILTSFAWIGEIQPIKRRTT